MAEKLLTIRLSTKVNCLFIFLLEITKSLMKPFQVQVKEADNGGHNSGLPLHFSPLSNRVLISREGS
jgi:hypothetical protein